MGISLRLESCYITECSTLTSFRIKLQGFSYQAAPHSFTHPLANSLHTHMPGTVLGTKDEAVNSTDIALHKWHTEEHHTEKHNQECYYEKSSCHFFLGSEK
jgi:hypothetical protein